MTYICDQCETSYDEMPKVCESCGGINFIESEEPVVISDDIGFRGKTGNIKKMIDVIMLPESQTKTFIPSFILTKKEDGFYVNLYSGLSLYGYFRFYNNFFSEVWGANKERIPIDSIKAMQYVDLMRSHDVISVNYNGEVFSVYEGKNDIISCRGEIFETINSCPDIRESHITKPVAFDETAFVPVLQSAENNFYNGCKITVNVSKLKVLIERAKKFKAEYYPFKIYPDRVEFGINDMSNPEGSGAFKTVIDCTIENAPSSGSIEVEVGSVFATIISNMTGDIEINFAGSDFPIWINGTFENDLSKVTGRFGYILPPRISNR